MAKKGEFILEFRAQELGLHLEKIGEEAMLAMQREVKEIAHGAFATITAMAQHGLHTTRADYLKGLRFQEIGENSYLIYLDGDYANALEEGYGGFSIRERMLKSSKLVEVGPRTGLPWVQKAKDGHRFAHVPFEHQPSSKAPQVADLAAAIKQLSATNAQGKEQKITKIFKDPFGNPIDSGVGKETKPVARVTDLSVLDNDTFGPLAGKLAGLVKYQKVYTNEKTGKKTVQSIYHTYRTVSEIGKDWVHPGFKGLHAFDQVEKWVAEQLDQILKEYIR